MLSTQSIERLQERQPSLGSVRSEQLARIAFCKRQIAQMKEIQRKTNSEELRIKIQEAIDQAKAKIKIALPAHNT